MKKTDPSGIEEDEKKELTKEEKEFMKKLEKGELELVEAKKGKQGPINKDPKYGIYSEMGYEVDPKLGLIYRDLETVSRQRKAIFQLIKNLGSNILHGKSLMNVSMPVTISDKLSMLQRSAGDFIYAPYYAEKMYSTDDPIEKMKYCVAFYVAGLHLNLSQKKPFNPIWGETFQAKIGDNLNVYAEQISHHPPISYLFLDAPHYQLDAKHEFALKVYPNSATFRCIGFRRVKLKDKQGTTYKIEYPWAESKGFMFGTRSFLYNGNVVIEDQTNKIYAQLRLNAGEKSFTEGLFKKQEARNDFFKGLITKNKALLDDNSRKAFYSKDMISYIEGNWIDYVMIDGENYWEIDKIKPAPLVPIKEPLPSDSSFRTDLVAWIADNEPEAQKQKELLENIQRNDRKLREPYQKAKK